MIELIKGCPITLSVSSPTGRVTNEECDNILKPAMERSLKRHSKIRLYYEVGSRFPGAGWDDLDVAIDHLPQWERIAIVTDTGWVRQFGQRLAIFDRQRGAGVHSYLRRMRARLDRGAPGVEAEPAGCGNRPCPCIPTGSRFTGSRIAEVSSEPAVPRRRRRASPA